MIFPCDYAYTYQIVVFKKVKSVLKMKNKKNKKVLTPRGTGGLPPWRWAAGTWHRVALSCPWLPPWRWAAGTWHRVALSCP
jgi:hypothetical protein